MFRTTAFLALLLSAPAYADESEEALEVQCDQYQAHVRDFDFTNGTPDKQQNTATTIYRVSDQLQKKSCLVNKHKVDLAFQVIGGGRCAGSLVTLSIDGGLIIKEAQFHYCGHGVTELGVSPDSDREGGYTFEACGYTPDNELPHFDGCVRIAAKQLAAVKKPLNSTFPIGELIKLVRLQFP